MNKKKKQWMKKLINVYIYISECKKCVLSTFFLQEIKDNPMDDSFSSFWPIVIYHVSFFIFITTIGLNIIFGIIVDTFSELRDLKVSSLFSGEVYSVFKIILYFFKKKCFNTSVTWKRWVLYSVFKAALQIEYP